MIDFYKLITISDGAEEKGPARAVKVISEYVKPYLEDKSAAYAERIVTLMTTKFKFLIDKDRRYFPGVARIICQKGLLPGLVDTPDNEVFKLWSILDKVLIRSLQNSVDRNITPDLCRTYIQSGRSITKELSYEDLEKLVASPQNRVTVSTHKYELYPVKSFKEASEFSKYADFCTFISEDEYNDYVNEFGNLYVLLRDDVDSYPKYDSRQVANEYDDYGLSLITVYYDGDYYYTTGRYNLTKNNMHYMSVSDLKTLIGENLFSKIV